jgi:hypothetical protein
MPLLPGNLADSDKSLHGGPAFSQEMAPLPADLASVVQVWESLPESAREQILVIAQEHLREEVSNICTHPAHDTFSGR